MKMFLISYLHIQEREERETSCGIVPPLLSARVPIWKAGNGAETRRLPEFYG